MTQPELKRKLKSTLRNTAIPINQEHLEFTKLLANNASCRFSGPDRIGFFSLLLMQIRFIGWKIWALQGIMLVAISCFLAASMGTYFMNNPKYVSMLLCCLSVIILMTALPFIHRSIHYKMHEIEATTHFSSVKLLMAKLLIIGIGDVLLLICTLCFALLRTPLSAGGAVLYVLFPFLLACCGLLYLLGHISAKRFAVGGIGLCTFLCAAFSLLDGVCPVFYQQTFSLIWVAVCLALLSICILQFRQLLHRCSYTEMQLV